LCRLASDSYEGQAFNSGVLSAQLEGRFLDPYRGLTTYYLVRLANIGSQDLKDLRLEIPGADYIALVRRGVYFYQAPDTKVPGVTPGYYEAAPVVLSLEREGVAYVSAWSDEMHGGAVTVSHADGRRVKTTVRTMVGPYQRNVAGAFDKTIDFLKFSAWIVWLIICVVMGVDAWKSMMRSLRDQPHAEHSRQEPSEVRQSLDATERREHGVSGDPDK